LNAKYLIYCIWRTSRSDICSCNPKTYSFQTYRYFIRRSAQESKKLWMIKARWICRVRLITVVKAAEKSRLVTSERYLSQCTVTSVFTTKACMWPTLEPVTKCMMYVRACFISLTHGILWQ